MRSGGLADVVEALDVTGAAPLLAVRGEHGSGRTTLLRDLGNQIPVVVATAVSLDADDDGWEMLSVALGHQLASDTSAGQVRDWLDGAALAVDDVQWLGPAARVALLSLAGTVPLVVTLADDEPTTEAIAADLAHLGARVVALEPLVDELAATFLTGLGVPAAEHASALAGAGGNLALLASATNERLPATVEQALATRLDALGPLGVTAAALLHLAGGASPVEAVSQGGRDALDRAGLLRREGASIVLRQGRLGERANDRLSDDERRAQHRRLAELTHDATAARHLELAGEKEQAAWHALAAAVEATPVDRADLLELVRRCRPVPADVALDRDLAGALIAAGRVGEAVKPAVDAGAYGLAASALRQAGRVEEACEALSKADGTDERAAVEAARLERWPGVAGLQQASSEGIGAVDIEMLDEALHGALDLAAGAERVAARGRDGDWDLAASIAGASVFVAAAHGDEASAHKVLDQLSEILTQAPVGPWHGSAEVMNGVVALHRGDGPASIGDALAAVVGTAHPLPGIAAAHLALALADSGRASDALGVVQAARQGPHRPMGMDAAVLTWAEAEVELLAGRPRKARRALAVLDDIPHRGTFGAMLAGLRTTTEGWVALDLAEAPPAAEVGGVVGAEMDGLRQLAAEEPTAGDALDHAAALWPSARAARRTRWAAAEARRRSGDVDEAVERLRSLEAESAAAGLLPLLARVRQSLRRAGASVKASRSSTSNADPSPRGVLSPREDEVVGLVAQGLSSGEIADRLGVGRSTVETQIASAMRKLGARTRRQAAALHLAARSA